MNPVVHKHHIVPRHMGGSDTPSNIVSLSLPQHAEAHRLLFEQHGKLEDKMAWLMLSGKTEEGEQTRREMTRQYMTSRVVTLETRNKFRHRMTGHKWSQESLIKRSATREGRSPSDETKRKLSEATTRWHQRRRGSL